MHIFPNPQIVSWQSDVLGCYIYAILYILRAIFMKSFARKYIEWKKE